MYKEKWGTVKNNFIKRSMHKETRKCLQDE